MYNYRALDTLNSITKSRTEYDSWEAGERVPGTDTHVYYYIHMYCCIHMFYNIAIGTHKNICIQKLIWHVRLYSNWYTHKKYEVTNWRRLWEGGEGVPGIDTYVYYYIHMYCCIHMNYDIASGTHKYTPTRKLIHTCTTIYPRISSNRISSVL